MEQVNYSLGVPVSIHAYLCVYAYIDKQMCVHRCIYVCMYMYIHLCECTDTHICTYVYDYMGTHVNMRLRAFSCLFTSQPLPILPNPDPVEAANGELSQSSLGPSKCRLADCCRLVQLLRLRGTRQSLEGYGLGFEFRAWGSACKVQISGRPDSANMSSCNVQAQTSKTPQLSLK